MAEASGRRPTRAKTSSVSIRVHIRWPARWMRPAASAAPGSFGPIRCRCSAKPMIVRSGERRSWLARWAKRSSSSFRSCRRSCTRCWSFSSERRSFACSRRRSTSAAARRRSERRSRASTAPRSARASAAGPSRRHGSAPAGDAIAWRAISVSRSRGGVGPSSRASRCRSRSMIWFRLAAEPAGGSAAASSIPKRLPPGGKSGGNCGTGSVEPPAQRLFPRLIRARPQMLGSKSGGDEPAACRGALAALLFLQRFDHREAERLDLKNTLRVARCGAV